MMVPSLSIVIVSFNTKDILKECLVKLFAYAKHLTTEVIIIDNHSHDGSQDMIREEFPEARLIESSVNLGFAAANNLGFRLARGRYIVLLNSDAFIHEDSLQKAFKHMEDNPLIGLGGGQLISRDGSWQPSARMLPSLLNDFLHMSGLAAKYPHSRFFGRADGTWISPMISRKCGWVPGAFAIVRKEVLEKVNYFDEKFFLYYEEVDLCQRISHLGYDIWYWADVIITHLGGESSKTVKHLSLTSAGTQLTLWRMRSQLLYYRKHGGKWKAWLSAQMEIVWNKLRAWKNTRKNAPENILKTQNAEINVRLMEEAWRDTKGGEISPKTPW
jgi:GT2 family glycosyltransferase